MQVADMPKLTISKIRENIGAEVRGIDLNQAVDGRTQQQLIDALHENVALVIRDQHFTAAQFLKAASLFGSPMQQDDPQFSVPGVPMVKALSNRQKSEAGTAAKVDSNWHTDHTNKARPPKYTMLYPVELPPSGGGTSVANARAAYAGLPQDLKKRLEGMKTANVRVGSAVKGRENTVAGIEQRKLNPVPVIQPLVRTNGDTGTKSLYFHRTKVENIIGMTPEESQELLTELLEHVAQPEFIYMHQWCKGDVLIWDNRSALHKANSDYDHTQHRMLYRIIIEGEQPY